MNKWFFINIIALFIAGWAIKTSDNFGLHTIMGGLGVILILFNWSRHAVFTTIRNSQNRQQKIRFANISKKVLPFHRWIGTTAVLIILFHGWLNINRYGFYWLYPKFMAGVVSVLVLIAVAIFGWLRLYWPSGRKRTMHLSLAMIMFLLMVLHLIL